MFSHPGPTGHQYRLEQESWLFQTKMTLSVALWKVSSSTTSNVVAYQLGYGLPARAIVEDAIFSTDKVIASIDGMRVQALCSVERPAPRLRNGWSIYYRGL